MDPMTRREFLGKTVVSAAAAGLMLSSAETASATPLGLPIGSQTYPHRAMIADGKLDIVVGTIFGTFTFTSKAAAPSAAAKK